MTGQNTLIKFNDSFDRSFTTAFNKRRSDPDMSWPEERAYAMSIIENSDELQQCSPHSVKVALNTVSAMGLSLNPERRHAYLIPRRPKAGKPYRCYATPSYLGLEYLARLSGDILNIYTDLVCENDPVFKQSVGPDGPELHHEAARSDRGEVTHAYTLTWYSNGSRAVEVMSRQDLDTIKGAAMAQSNGKLPPSWRFYEHEMMKKSVSRRSSKHWPISSSRMQKAMAAMDQADPIDFKQPSGLLLSQKQFENIISLIAELGMDVDQEVKNLCSAYGVSSLSEILSDQTQSIKRGLHNRAKAAKTQGAK